MAPSSWNSSGSTQLQNNSGSEEDLELVIVERKRKRMQSNRESARRSRMRKQQQLDGLMGQVNQSKKENSQILTSINITTQHLKSIESENSILRAQMMELSQRLQSLNDILSYINRYKNGIHEREATSLQNSADSFMNTGNNLLCFNQPIMVSTDMLQYY